MKISLLSSMSLEWPCASPHKGNTLPVGDPEYVIDTLSSIGIEVTPFVLKKKLEWGVFFIRFS